MSIISKFKSLLPASSRSLHAMYHELGQMHGQMGQMWGEVGESRYMLMDIREQLKQLRELRELHSTIHSMDARQMVLLWELYRKEGESLADAKKRLVEGLEPASGNNRMYQLACAQLLAEFDAFCTKNGLQYWLMSGTLLGAVRHKGFIPWDDDLDVGMTRADIQRIIQLVQDDERYRVTVRYDWYVNCRQVRFCYADESVPCFIDLFYFDPVAHLGKETFVAREAERAALEADLRADEALAAYWHGGAQFVSEPSDEAASVAAHFDTHVAALYEKGVLTESLDQAEGLIWSIDNVNSGVAHHTWYLVPKEAIFPLCRMSFEGRDAYVPADYDRCLRDIFGEYYDLPQTMGSYFDHQLDDALNNADVREHLEVLAAQYRSDQAL